jgi:putative aldouronate transport system substrate-binding protein
MSLEYPTGPRGQKGVYDKDLIRGYNVIPKGASNPEGAVRYLEFLAGDEGYTTLKLGFENQIWSMQNGKMVTDFAQHDKHLYRGIYQSMVDVLDPELNKKRLDSLGDFHLYENLKIIEQNLIPNEFYGSPTPAMSQLSGQLPNLLEAFTRIIMGVEPLDAFDKYVAEWKTNGGALITQEVNAWYKEKNAAAGKAFP